MTIEVPAGIIPVRDLTTTEILYGARTTTFRYEVLTHNTSTGIDTLAGYLDGVEPGGSLTWSAGASIKKSGTITVLDLAAARPGMLRVADINIVTARIRPVLLIDGLPEIPLSTYIITAAPETWTDTGRQYALELHDKSGVLADDKVDQTYTVAAGTGILTALAALLATAGETIAVDASETRTAASAMVWPVGTAKLTIANDLLGALNYNSLWVDGAGSFKATPYVTPANRSIRYAVLNDETGAALMRELVDGDSSIYLPAFKRDRDSFNVPNKVVTVQTGSGTTTPLTGLATNTSSSSPYSYAARGRWLVTTIDGVEVPDYSADLDGGVANTTAFLNAKAQRSLIAASAVQAAVNVSCLPIPLELLDAIRFESTPAGIDARHTVQTARIPLQFDGLMALDLQEVIDL